MKPLPPCSHCGGRVLVEPTLDDFGGTGPAYEAKCAACGRSPIPPRVARLDEEDERPPVAGPRRRREIKPAAYAFAATSALERARELAQ